MRMWIFRFQILNVPFWSLETFSTQVFTLTANSKRQFQFRRLWPVPVFNLKQISKNMKELFQVKPPYRIPRPLNCVIFKWQPKVLFSLVFTTNYIAPCSKKNDLHSFVITGLRQRQRGRLRKRPRLCSKENWRTGVKCFETVKSRVPSIRFVWKN